MNRDIIRLSIGDFALSSSNLRLAMSDLCLRRSDLGIEFGNLEYGQHLAVLDSIPYIDVDAPNIAGYFGVKIYLLIRLELTRHR
jgi:hypothetical protein